MKKVKKKETKRIKFEGIPNGEFPGVYVITNKKTHKPYVGQTIKSINERLEQHINNEKVSKDSDSIDRAIQELGIDAFTYKVDTYIPREMATRKLLWQLEHQAITRYNSRQKGYNLTSGNEKDKYKPFIDPIPAVNTKLFSEIEDEYYLSYRGKNILLIGNFDKEVESIVRWKSNCIFLYEATDTVDQLKNYIIKELTELAMKNIKFDLIIANPPYGKACEEITNFIVNNIDFKEYVNLMPLSWYYSTDSLQLYKHLDINSIKKFGKYMFDGAKVKPSLAKITKEANHYITEEMVRIESIDEDIFKKYLYSNVSRECPFTKFTKGNSEYIPGHIKPSNSFAIGHCDMYDGKIRLDKNTVQYRWNVLKNITNDTAAKDMVSTIHFLTQGGDEEKNINFTNFVYKYVKFFNKLFEVINGGRGVYLPAFPWLDWSREYTLEEMLKEYEYSDSEIEKIKEIIK